MQGYRIWECLVCGWVYDELKGAPEDGIPPKTRWEDVPDDWLCPECGVGKSDFEMIEVHTQPSSTATSTAASTATQNDSPKTQEAAGSNVELATFANIDYARKPIIVIGTGLAGYQLAKELRKHDASTPLIMITADDGNSYSKPQLSTAFQKRRSPEQLVSYSAREMAETLQANILTFSKVSAIDTDAHTVTIDSGRQQSHQTYDKLVLALGSEPIHAPVAGNAAGCALHINDLQDFQRFYTAASGAKSALVIGGGLIGCEYANDLVQSGFEVHVVEPQSQVLGNLLPPDASALVQTTLSQAGVNFHLGTTVKSLDYRGSGVQAELENGAHIQVDRVISAIGVRPRVELAQQCGIPSNRGILTDRLLATEIEDVYALGDCAEVDGHNLCYVAPLLASAQALARTLAGTPTPVFYDSMPVNVKTTLCPVITSPPPRETVGDWHYTRADNQGVAARFTSPNGELLGFALAGDACQQVTEFSEQAPPIMQN
ncbi:FAD-dependent oxidoreductase [Microbulbifer agarilyticus]|uniref:FAD-dependent oxidoreductase n=1 Tax=Microbulbifer agarilyticus TaxID=260552 RepID=UPI001C955400|nr:FAD-dependent oxidoreductase [Microbulbifer agarilyticus]MBY6189619.1 FAD-dependent oxidoreductase [Microbulbifer agarilyticus]